MVIAICRGRNCSNRKILYLDEIEKAVLTGLQQHLKARMKEAQAEIVALLAELEAQPEVEKIVGLHPAALQHFEKLVGQLGEVFGRGVTPDNEEAAEKIRELVAKVAVRSWVQDQASGTPYFAYGCAECLPQHAHRRVGENGGSGGALPPFPTMPEHTLSSPIVRLTRILAHWAGVEEA